MKILKNANFLGVVLLWLFVAVNAVAAENKINLSPLFIQLSDAMSAVKESNPEQAKQDIEQIQQQFIAIPQHTSPAGKVVLEQLTKTIANTDIEQLNQLSVALLAFDKEQHPLDIAEQKKLFKKRIVPAFDHWQKVITEQKAQPDVEVLKQQYRLFNSIWTKNERLVRDVDMSYYGKIETALALLRVAIETEPLDYQRVEQNTQKIATQFDDFLSGKKTENVTGNYQLSDGVNLLKEGLAAFQQQDNATAQEKLTTFIEIWPIIEGDVSTRDGSLYTRVESEVPVILAKGQEPKYQANLQQLIDQLAAINPAASYTAIDAMLILLREGLEALLVVMALVSALRVANRPQGYKWVSGGVVAGLLLSLVAAFALQRLFPAASSGTNREIIEGGVGIVAVLMILTIGAWLHSKSSVKAWQAYIKKHMGKALTTGSFVSLFGLSFLSVFREGAETILFYVGILPNISTESFALGVGIAVVILAVLAVIILKSSVKLPVPTMFKILTWVLYVLGFKILGVSVHSLQITHILPITIVDSLPNIEWLGFYATLETIIAQVIYIALIVLLQKWLQRNETATA
ncbi:iron permease [Gallibacterium salpingitidis]|uniref:Iron permease n=1 Tax=Gallibacterium salpingitidis TaxID=505341 RepID=A0AB36E5Y9_9PAST|nr:FTR1 family protein [Gallibacterium salpingitidis]OBX07475.1 iron permease [Gallibacterium salpingitidis]OBX10816.1 iron permease [Gallibacterium salpingitidis]WKS99197.1 FTR1 family iron permease [Gallibacterium salpingitidis]